MKKKTRKALEGSIRKWKRIIMGEDVDRGPVNCSLCLLFFNGGEGENGCHGCPVFFFTNKQGCENTPYDDWNTYQESRGNFDNAVVFDAKSLALAKAEMHFLKSLRR